MPRLLAKHYWNMQEASAVSNPSVSERDRSEGVQGSPSDESHSGKLPMERSEIQVIASRP